MKHIVNRWIALFVAGVFALRQFWRISSFAIDDVSPTLARTYAILCGMTIALMSSWLLPTLWRNFAARIETTRTEEQLVTYTDILSEPWETEGVGDPEHAAYDPGSLPKAVSPRGLSRKHEAIFDVYPLEVCERWA